MSGNALRNFAIALLDDEHGINSVAWDTLRDLLDEDEQTDILNAIKAQDGRFYLPSESIAALFEVSRRD